MKFLIAVLALFATSAFAADSSTSANTSVNSSSTSISTTAPSLFENIQIGGGLKSFNTTGRYSDSNGRNLKSKNEYYIEGKNKQGWGLQVMANETAVQYIRSEKNTFSPQDPSVSIIHPIYKGETFTMSGQFKQYFPVADYSVKQQIYEQTYYLNINMKLAQGYELFNQFIPRYFSQARYAKTDTTFYAEDYTKISKMMNSWARLGFGQHAQLEGHNDAATGTTVELFPYADLMLSPTVYLGPRVYLPVWTQNTVYDAPKAVSTANVQGELYLQATL